MSEQPNFLQHLGLNEVAGDPNDIPDSDYDGIISRSEYVLVKSKGTLAHVTTFQVTEGDAKGAERQKWDTLYKDVKDENGEFPEDLTKVKSITPAQSKAQKEWYKKFWLEMGIPEAKVDNGTAHPSDLVGLKVTFGIKTKQGYKNVSYQRLRDVAPVGPVSVTPGLNVPNVSPVAEVPSEASPFGGSSQPAF